MNTNPDCHPETPESGQEWARLVRCQSSRPLSQDEQEREQQTITLEHRKKLLKVILDAQALIDFAWRARFTSYYNDNKLALNALNEVRLYEHSINQHLKTLPPTADFPDITTQPKADN